MARFFSTTSMFEGVAGASGPPFVDLTLTNYTIAEDAGEVSFANVVGALGGDYVIDIVSQSNASWFRLEEPELVANGIHDYETNPSPTVTIREFHGDDSAYDVDNPVGPYHDTTLTITVTDVAEHDAAATALFARMSPAPDATRKGVINTLILALKTGATSATDIWAKLDVLYVLAADAEANSLLEWKGNTAYDAVKSGTPTFTADRGWVITNAGGDYLATGYEPATSSLGFAQNDAHAGAYVTTNSADTGADLGFNGSTQARVRATATPFVSLNASGAANAFAPVGNGPHHIVGNRTGSTAFTAYRNGISGANQAGSSSNIGGGGPLFLASSGTLTGGSSRMVAINHCGVALTTAEIFDAYTAFAAYLTAIGSPA